MERIAGPPPFSEYIVFVDESGDHSLESIDPGYPVFVLVFCVIRCSEYVDRLSSAIRKLKFATFGHDMVVLHEADIRRKRGAFAHLSKEPRENFLNALTGIIDSADFQLIAVVIDKQRLKERHAVPGHPYHLAMRFGLERLHDLTHRDGHDGHHLHVVCEARGAKEDREIAVAFRQVCDGDNGSGRTYPFSIVVAHKHTNSEGLQLADLVARPIGQRVLRPEQPNRTWEVLARKLYTGRDGIATGNGLEVFP